jgi:hypothetical protein
MPDWSLEIRLGGRKCLHWHCVNDKNFLSYQTSNSVFPVFDHIRGSFQKFCTLYVFSLKMNLFCKIHLQAFNVISIVPITVVQRLGKSCIPLWTPSLLMRLVTQVPSLDTSSMLLKRFPRFQFREQVKVWWAQPTRLWLVPKIEETSPWEKLQKHWGGV